MSTPDRERAALGKRLLYLAMFVTALAYSGTLRFQFVYDDQSQIVANPTLASWKIIPWLFTGHNWAFLMPDWAGNYYRPLFMSWLVANRVLFGLNPLWWHATTVLLHVLATALSYIVARQVLRDCVSAAFVALLFGLHPIHIESVAWISGVTDPLMSIFAFAAFWAWLRGEREPDRRWAWQLLSAICYACAGLSKEAALFLPAVVVTYDVLFRSEEPSWKRVVSLSLNAWPLFLTGVVYIVARTVALRGLIHSVGTLLSWNLLTIPTILLGYMRRLVWPVQLAVAYDTPPVTSALQWRFWLPLLAWLLIGGLVWRIGKRSRVFVFSLSWIFVFLAPAIIGLPSFPLNEWIHDRYLYLPAFGFCLLLGHVIRQLPAKGELFGLPILPAAVTFVLASLMALGTSWEQQYWVNDYILFQHNVMIQPRNALSKVHLANEVFRTGNVPETERLYLQALQLEPANWRNNVLYGLMLFYSGQFDKADQQLGKAIAISGSDSNTYFYQGLSRFNLGNYPGAQHAFEQALRHGPNYARYHFWRGFSLERQYRLDEARKEYEEELRLHPDTDTEAAKRLTDLTLSQK